MSNYPIDKNEKHRQRQARGKGHYGGRVKEE